MKPPEFDETLLDDAEAAAEKWDDAARSNTEQAMAADGEANRHNAAITAIDEEMKRLQERRKVASQLFNDAISTRDSRNADADNARRKAAGYRFMVTATRQVAGIGDPQSSGDRKVAGEPSDTAVTRREPVAGGKR